MSKGRFGEVALAISPAKNMQRFFIFILTLTLVVPSFVFAQIATSTNPWAIMAQYASGAATETPVIERDTVFTFSKSILALVAAGGNPRTGTYGDLAQEFLNSHTRERQIGNPAYVNDDFWGILALRSAGVSMDDDAIRNARSYIERAQKSNGGWSWSTTFPTADVDDTAAAIMALLESGVAPSDSMIQRALDYLHSAQNEDGGFPSVPPGASTVESTAWVASALSKAGENPSAWAKSGKNPIGYLRSQEKSDGSFGGVQATAFAVIALAGKSFPVRSYIPPRDEPGASEAMPPIQHEQPRVIQIPSVVPPPAPPPKSVVKKATPVKKKVVKKPVKKAKKKIKKTSPKPSPKRRG